MAPDGQIPDHTYDLREGGTNTSSGKPLFQQIEVVDRGDQQSPEALEER